MKKDLEIKIKVISQVENILEYLTEEEIRNGKIEHGSLLDTENIEKTEGGKLYHKNGNIYIYGDDDETQLLTK